MIVRPVSASRVPRVWLVFGAIALVVVALDQASKLWVESSFSLVSSGAAPGTPGAPTPVIGDLVRIARSWNDGGIFGMLGASAAFLGIASLVVIAAILWVEARQGVHSLLLTVALALLLGGAVGNLIDRLRYGHVVDWVDTGIGDARWYTFNVADAAISTSVVLLLVIGSFGHRLARTGDGGETRTGDGGETRTGDGGETRTGADTQVPNGGHP